MKTETSAVDINRSIGDFAYPEVHVRDAGAGLSEKRSIISRTLKKIRIGCANFVSGA
jgi:hypothetical protein